jgi:hypothetical protein
MANHHTYSSIIQPAHNSNLSSTFTQALYYLLFLCHIFLNILTPHLLQLSLHTFSPYIQSLTRQGRGPHTKGTPKEHALHTYNLKAHWRKGKPLLGYIYILFCSLLHAHICFPKPIEPLITRKRRKGKQHHTRTNQTTTVYNNPFSNESSSAHSEPDYKCKYKNFRNKANPPHLTNLYNLVTHSNTTRGNTPETTICHHTSRNTTQHLVQHTTIPPLLPSMPIPQTHLIYPTSPSLSTTQPSPIIGE